MKTILEYFSDFPPAWRDEAIARLTSAVPCVADRQTTSPANALAEGFYWAGDGEVDDDWNKWNERHKELLALQEQQTAPSPPTLSNTNLLIGCLYELNKAAMEADYENLQFIVQSTIDSTLAALTPPCDLSTWNNDYPA